MKTPEVSVARENSRWYTEASVLTFYARCEALSHQIRFTLTECVRAGVMIKPVDTGFSKVKVSTGDAHADAIIERANSLPTAGEMAAHVYHLHRLFE